MDIPTMKREWNVNTIVTTLTLILMIFGGGGAWSSVNSRLDDNAQEINENKITLKDNKEKYDTDFGRIGQRFAELELKMGEIPLLKQQQAQTEANLNNINQRMDRQFTDMNNSVKEARDGINKVATQVEVLTQILQRMEVSSRASNLQRQSRAGSESLAPN